MCVINWLINRCFLVVSCVASLLLLFLLLFYKLSTRFCLCIWLLYNNCIEFFTLKDRSSRQCSFININLPVSVYCTSLWLTDGPGWDRRRGEEMSRKIRRSYNNIIKVVLKLDMIRKVLYCRPSCEGSPKWMLSMLSLTLSLYAILCTLSLIEFL